MAVGGVVLRRLYVGEQLWTALQGAWYAERGDLRLAMLRADLERFVEGRPIDPSYLFWLTPKSDLVWEIRSVQPAPSLRVFCRFAMPDVLIATHYEERSYLGQWGAKEWRDAIVNSKIFWRQLFATYEPVAGSSVNEFITFGVLDERAFSKRGDKRPRTRLSPP